MRRGILVVAAFLLCLAPLEAAAEFQRIKIRVLGMD